MMKKTRRFQVCNVLEMETESSHYENTYFTLCSSPKQSLILQKKCKHLHIYKIGTITRSQITNSRVLKENSNVIKQ